MVTVSTEVSRVATRPHSSREACRRKSPRFQALLYPCRWVCWTCTQAQAEVGQLGAPQGCFPTSSPVYICFLFLLIATSLGPLSLLCFLAGADLGDLPAGAWGAGFFLPACVLNKGQGDSHFEGSDDIIFLCLRIRYRPPFIFNLPPHPSQAC